MDKCGDSQAFPQIVHGLYISRNEAPPKELPETARAPFILDLTYTREIPPPSGPPVWSQRETDAREQTTLFLHRENSGWRLDIKCQGSGTFFFHSDGIRAYWQPGGTDITHYLSGIGLAIWFELKGIPCFHGNSLAHDGRAFALLGSSQAGKSTLTTALIQKGISFLSDDLVVPRKAEKEWLIYPAPSPLRMWPRSLQHFKGNEEINSLARVHAGYEKRQVPVETALKGTICQTAVPLKAIYILNRVDAERHPTLVEAIKPSEAVVTLIKQSLSGEMPAPLGLENKRLSLLAQITSAIPIKSLTYPSGYQNLGAVTDFLLSDLSKD